MTYLIRCILKSIVVFNINDIYFNFLPHLWVKLRIHHPLWKMNTSEIHIPSVSSCLIACLAINAKVTSVNTTHCDPFTLILYWFLFTLRAHFSTCPNGHLTWIGVHFIMSAKRKNKNTRIRIYELYPKNAAESCSFPNTHGGEVNYVIIIKLHGITVSCRFGSLYYLSLYF